MLQRNRDSEMYINIIRMRLVEIKSKVRIEKEKVKQELGKVQILKDEIMKLLSELNSAGLVKNFDEIIGLMDGIDKKYGLEDSCETELSRLYVEITDGFILHGDSGKTEDDEAGDNENGEKIKYLEYIKHYDEMERKYSLCRHLYNRVELVNFEYTMLRDRLSKIKIEKSKKENEKELDDSLII